MKDVRNDELIRLSMKPMLSPDDELRIEAFLASHPEARATWEEERAVGRALQSLPDVPVSSNFTSRVLQAVDWETAREEREPLKPTWLRAFWPRLSWATVATVLALTIGYQYRTNRRSRLAQDIALVSQDAIQLPSAEVLRDFDAINQMRAASDDELLVVLK